jgi:hypothetical protein
MSPEFIFMLTTLTNILGILAAFSCYRYIKSCLELLSSRIINTGRLLSDLSHSHAMACADLNHLKQRIIKLEMATTQEILDSIPNIQIIDPLENKIESNE